MSSATFEPPTLGGEDVKRRIGPQLKRGEKGGKREGNREAEKKEEEKQLEINRRGQEGEFLYYFLSSNSLPTTKCTVNSTFNKSWIRRNVKG